jgi:radical SAM superfamily enzyme YgiQ (UPF0313 family)
MATRPKTLIVIPPWEGLHGFPLGPAYLASTLENYGNPVAVLDSAALGLKLYELGDWIQAAQPDIVPITSVTATYHSALDVAKIAKEVRSRSLTVMGGPHVSWTSEITLKHHPEVDVIARWEGEYTLLDLVNTYQQKRSLKNVQGISYRDGNEIKHNPDRPVIKNLDELSFPARHLFPPQDLYNVEIYGEEIDKDSKSRKATTMIVSRGCPYKCDYCASSAFWGNKIRFRSNENVMQEIRQLYHRDGYRAIYFEDDQFTPDKKRTMDLCNSIIREGMDLKWMCETRADTTDRELLGTMSKAGCDSIFFGVEASEQVRYKAGKKISDKKIVEAFQNCKDFDIGTVASVQFGLQKETNKIYDRVDETVALLKVLDPSQIIMSFTAYYPGAPISIRDKIDYEMFERRAPDNETERWKKEHLAHGINTHVTPPVSNLARMRKIHGIIEKAFPDKIWNPGDEIKRREDFWESLYIMGGCTPTMTVIAFEDDALKYRRLARRQIKALARTH